MRPKFSYSNYSGWGRVRYLSFWFLGFTLDWGTRRWIVGFERTK